MTLDEAKCGCKYRVDCIEGDTCGRMRMISLGLCPGREITCHNNQWSGIIIECAGCKLAMRKEEAEKITINPME